MSTPPHPPAIHGAAKPPAATQIAEGLFMPLGALRFLLSHKGIKRFAALPLIANAVLYIAAIFLGFYLLSQWDTQVAWEFWGPIGGWLATGFNWTSGSMKWIIALPVVFLLCYFSFTIVGMVIASPFNDILSQRTEYIIRETQSESPPLGLTLRVMIVSLIDSLKIAATQVALVFLTLPLLIIPIVGFLPLMLVTAYFTGRGFYDIPLACNSIAGRHKKPYTQRRFLSLIGFGLAMELLFMIPFVGLLMLPVGVTAGTQMYCRDPRHHHPHSPNA